MERKRKMNHSHWLVPYAIGNLIWLIATIFLVLHLLDWYHLSEVAFMCIALIALGLICQSIGTIVGVIKRKVWDD